eukprot:4014518-Pyramimonas_sp.AAC.1
MFRTLVDMLPAALAGAKAPLQMVRGEAWADLSAAEPRWGRVKGSLGAVAANLLDLGWGARSRTVALARPCGWMRV